jgi:hypothetical protein
VVHCDQIAFPDLRWAGGDATSEQAQAWVRWVRPWMNRSPTDAALVEKRY